MKKGTIAVIIGIAALLMILLATPVLFKGKIVEKVKRLANESVKAKVDFSELNLSLIKSFPRLNLELKNLTITGINDFEGKELFNVPELNTTVNLSSLWSSSGLQINSVYLKNPTIHLLSNKEGKANWDIVKPTAQTATTDSKSTQIDLDKIEILKGEFVYEDLASPMEFRLKNGDFLISGKMKGSNSQIDVQGSADSIGFTYAGNNYASNLVATVKGGLQADFDKMSFNFLKNELRINKLPVELEGNFTLNPKDYLFDLRFKSPSSSFADLLGFIPTAYQKYLKGVETKGELTFSGFVKGTYSEATYPAIGTELKLNGGRLKYPNLPREVEKVEIAAAIAKPQGSLDLTTINISRFEASIAGNPINGDLNVATPISDPQLKGNLKGRVDFNSIKQAIPMDSIDVKGVIDAAIGFDGNYSSIEKGEYQKFKTQGNLSLKDFLFASKSLPQKVLISNAAMAFNPQSISLTGLNGTIGESDFSATGSITNYWSYLLKKGILSGTMNIKSNYLNINQLMPTSSTKDTTSKTKPFEVPENIDFVLQSSVARALYDKMNITGITGKILLKDRKAILDGLNMGLLSGKVVVSGAYSTPKNQQPDFNLKLDIKDFDLPTAYQSFSTVRHFVPIAQQSTGSFNSGLTLAGKIGEGYMPVFSSMNGSGLLTAKNIELIESSLFGEIGKYFKKDLFKQVKIADFMANFKVVNGGLEVAPFSTKIAGQEVTFSGRQSAANVLDYRIDFKVNKEDLSDEVNKYIGIVPGTENIAKYPIGINLVGAFNKPEVKVDLTEARKLVETEFKKKAGSTIKDAVKKMGLDKLFK